MYDRFIILRVKSTRFWSWYRKRDMLPRICPVGSCVALCALRFFSLVSTHDSYLCFCLGCGGSWYYHHASWANPAFIPWFYMPPRLLGATISSEGGVWAVCAFGTICIDAAVQFIVYPGNVCGTEAKTSLRNRLGLRRLCAKWNYGDRWRDRHYSPLYWDAWRRPKQNTGQEWIGCFAWRHHSAPVWIGTESGMLVAQRASLLRSNADHGSAGSQRDFVIEQRVWMNRKRTL